MIRKTRLVKVIFGCCAAIFLILQFLETRPTASEATTTAAGSGDLKSTKHEAAAAVVNALPASKSEAVKPLPVVVRVVPAAAASLPPNPPVAAAALLAGSKNSSSSKEVPSASGAPAAAEPSETKTEPKSSLSGERIHGLPNETQITPKAVVVSDLKIARILDKIKLVNEEQSIRNEGAKYLGFFSSCSLKTRKNVLVLISQFCTVGIFFDESVFTFQFLNDTIHNNVSF